MQRPDYADSTTTSEHTATCCLGDVFFRKRRLTSASDYYKPKLPLDNNNAAESNNDDDSSGGKLAASSSTERTLAAAAGAAGHGVNLNSKYATSSDDNSRGRALCAADVNDSYSRAVVNQPLDRLLASGSRHASLQDSNTDLPPRSYTTTSCTSGVVLCEGGRKLLFSVRQLQISATGDCGFPEFQFCPQISPELGFLAFQAFLLPVESSTIFCIFRRKLSKMEIFRKAKIGGGALLPALPPLLPPRHCHSSRLLSITISCL